MEIYTTGFTKKTAAQFFGSLKQAGMKQLMDIRLHNSSQLAGFAKKDDLAFFLKEICDIAYVYEPLFAPTQAMLDEYRKQKGGWARYEQRFLALMRERRVEEKIQPEVFAVISTLKSTLAGSLRYVHGCMSSA